MANRKSVIYGGIDLASVSPAFRLIDVQIGPVERETNNLNAPSSDGLLFGSAKNAGRTSFVSFDIADGNLSRRFEALQRLNMILASKIPRPLEAPPLGETYLNAICTGFPSPSALEWTGEMQIQFLSPDPFKYSRENLLSVDLADGATKTFYVNCSGSVRPIITQVLSAAVDSPMWDTAAGDYIIIQGNVGPGTLVIDCTQHDIFLDGVSILEKMSLDSTFFEFDPNPATRFDPYTIVCSNGAAGKMVGKYRWL